MTEEKIERMALIAAGILVVSALTAGGAAVVLVRRANNAMIAALSSGASEALRLYGIKAPVIILQAAHESGWGNSQLATTGNNFFGMTVTNAYLSALRGERPIDAVAKWTAAGTGHEVISLPSREYDKRPPEKIVYFRRPGDILSKEPDGRGGSKLMVETDFKKYASPLESVLDWAKLISSAYPAAYAAARAGDLKAFSSALANPPAGQPRYATDPNYFAAMNALIPAVQEAVA